METNEKTSRCEEGSNEKSSDLMRLVDANLAPPGARHVPSGKYDDDDDDDDDVQNVSSFISS